MTREATSRAAVGGNAIAYPGIALLPDALGGSPRQTYVSRRGATGWTTRSVTPPIEPEAGPQLNHVSFLSADLSKVLADSNALLVPDQAPPVGPAGRGTGLYREDLTTFPATFRLLNPEANPPLPGFGDRPTLGAATDDLSHVVFNTQSQLLPGAPFGPGTQGLYEWTDGELRIASVLPNGNVADFAFAGGRELGQATRYPGGNPISEDGSRLYFTVGGGSTEAGLYLRDNGTATKVVSASERDGADPEVPTGRAEFLHASADGSIAFFASPNPLTDDATAPGGAGSPPRDLYRWDAEAEPGERLTDLTTQDPAGGGVLGDAFGTDDGSHLYFVATGNLAPGATPGANNLYLWRRGDGIRHVATLGGADGSVWSAFRAGETRYRDARISADGERLLFASRAQLTDFDTDGHRQIYLYDATEDEITCVSCSSLSEPSTANASLLALPPAALATGPIHSPLILPDNLSSDGARAFFQTSERLLRADTNGTDDVYEWEDGNLSLISDGQSPHRAEFLAASADGDDVFFITREQLVGSDRDHLADVYDARVGGGFPEPEPSRPCIGDECQRPVPAPPDPTTPGTATFSPGDDESLRSPVNGGNADCAALEREAARKARQARRLDRRARKLSRRTKKASGKEARKLNRRAKKVKRQADTRRSQAKQTKAKARDCKRSEA